ncbi:MAG: hypothetical protein V1685_03555 [Parcubacteria group bacterium]
MKKSSLLMIIFIGSTLGVILFFFTSNSANPSSNSPVVLNTIQKTPTVTWTTYTASGDFTLKYPQGWSVNPNLYGVEPQKNEWQFVLVGEKHPNGAIDTFPFVITRFDNPEQLSCRAWLQKDMEEEIQAMIGRGGASRADAEEYFRVRYEPVTMETFSTYDACKLPQGRGEDIVQAYVVTQGDKAYMISYPRPGLPADRALDSTQNAKVALGMMDRLVFTNNRE